MACAAPRRSEAWARPPSYDAGHARTKRYLIPSGFMTSGATGTQGSAPTSRGYTLGCLMCALQAPPWAGRTWWIGAASTEMPQPKCHKGTECAQEGCPCLRAGEAHADCCTASYPLRRPFEQRLSAVPTPFHDYGRCASCLEFDCALREGGCAAGVQCGVEHSPLPYGRASKGR